VRPVNIVDLFAGPGGLDVAAEKLGSSTKGLNISTEGIEWDPSACETRRAAGLSTRQGDVRRFGPSDFPEANVLAGGPPCQTFTVAGAGAGRRALDEVLSFVERMVARDKPADIERDLARLEDERTGLVLEPLRWALDAIDHKKPYEAIVLEQVPAVLPVWKEYEKILKGKGYKANSWLLKTEEYGVPQTRRRAVLIARLAELDAREISRPKPTHQTFRKGVLPRDKDRRLSDKDREPKPWRTMAEALNRPTPFHVISNYGTGGDPKARGRRESYEPSATVTGKIFRNRVVCEACETCEHPDRFRPWEAGRLQTFPCDYPWRGRDVGQQIGNAVPPLLAMHVLSVALGLDQPGDEQIESLETWTADTVPVQSIRGEEPTKDLEYA
jgi:site-specific DNA-cytosine methylase